MRYIFLIGIILFGTAANAQTKSQTGVQTFSQPTGATNTTAANGQTTTTNDAFTTSNSGSDPLSVPTATLPTGPSGESATPTGPARKTGTAGASAGGISASSANTSEVPLQLPGETPDTSSQAASSTAAITGHSAPICPPPVPTTDGGSAHLTGMAGISLGGC